MTNNKELKKKESLYFLYLWINALKTLQESVKGIMLERTIRGREKMKGRSREKQKGQKEEMLETVVLYCV